MQRIWGCIQKDRTSEAGSSIDYKHDLGTFVVSFVEVCDSGQSNTKFQNVFTVIEYKKGSRQVFVNHMTKIFS